MSNTLEVSQIAKSIARPLGLNEDLVEAIALGYDLGHTAYGHVGETVLNEKMSSIGKIFNYNIQSTWLVQKMMYNRKNRNAKFIPAVLI
jgi:dGTP triphosphohydrolase